MSFGNTAETDILKQMFNSVATPWDANPDWYIALHSSDPGEGAAQNTSEISYTGYARVAVDRSTAAEWTVASGSVENAILIQFGLCTAGTAAATHFTIGTASSGAGYVAVVGDLSATLNIAAGIQPQFSPGELTGTLN